MAQEHNQDLLMTLGLTPRWASARPQEPSGYQPGFAAEPVDIGDWRAFVTAVTTRYKGRLHYYEIWNEPNLKQFWSGNVDQLLALTREASQIIHNIDPQAIVVSPPATSGYGVKWLTEFLSKGGGQYVDVIGYHFYVADQPPEAMVPVIRQVQQTMADNGVGNKPIWDTEAGWFKPNPFPSAELGAGYAARAFILNWAAGVQRFYW
jgi:endo-1,4-beta-mannosidase